MQDAYHSKVVKDYQSCSSNCKECLADDQINVYAHTTYCDLFRELTDNAKNEISKLMDKLL